MPVLEVLVGKTLEQGMMEVLEEEELSSIRRRQAMFEQMRQAELLEVQRMEAAKERRLNQEKARHDEQLSAFKKAHSRAVARTYLGGMRLKVLDVLEHAGLFRDPVELVVESEFMPWLVDQVVQEIGAAGDRQKDVKKLVEAAGEDLAKPHREALHREQRILNEQQALIAFDELREKGPEPDLEVWVCDKLVEEGEDPTPMASCKPLDNPEAEVALIALAEGMYEKLKEILVEGATQNVMVHP